MTSIIPTRVFRELIVAEAKSWLHTPFVNQQCVKGAGADCGMFPLAVYSSIGLIPRINPGAYSVQIHMHKTAEEQRACGQKPYIDFAEELLRAVESPEPGDFVLFHIGKCFSHGGIVIEWPTIIHAHIKHGVIFDDAARNGKIMRKPRRFFSPFGRAA